jgi:hypothetical protein
MVSRVIEENPIGNWQVTAKLSGVWLQNWVELRHVYDGDRLQWN